MKKLMQAFLVFGLVLAASSTAAPAAEKLKIATEGAYPPFNYIDDAGKLAGFDVDLAKAVCERIGADCEFVQVAWDDLIPGLLDRKYDVISASMSITEERQNKVAFTIPCYSNMLAFVGQKGTPITIDKSGLAGKSVGVQRGTIAQEYLASTYSGVVTERAFDTQEEANAELAAGKVELVISDYLPSYAWLQKEEGKGFSFVGEFIDINDRIGMALRKEDNELRERMDQALIQMLEDGTYQQLNAKYFPFSIYF
jgi:polar amino acid transport system substrate-binding protein